MGEIIAVKSLALVLRNGRSKGSLYRFWNATSLDAVAGQLAANGARDRFAHLTGQALQAQAHHARYGAARLEEAGTSGEFVTRTIKKALDEETGAASGRDARASRPSCAALAPPHAMPEASWPAASRAMSATTRSAAG